jgi:DNA helicase-2/ATP-dependent DNA helicase PcrA
MDELEISSDQFNPQPVQAVLSQAKNELIDWELYQETATDYFSQTVAKIYGGYQAHLKSNNILDFDDLLVLLVNSFYEQPAVLEK